MECAPAFNYARSPHTTEILPDLSAPPTNVDQSSSQLSAHEKVLFSSPDASLSLDLRYVAEATTDCVARPEVNLTLLDLKNKGHLGLGVCCDMILQEGQTVW